MKSPTINNYLEAVMNPAGRFRSLAGLEILRDGEGQFRYAVRTRTLDIAVSYRQKEWVMSCPLRHDEVFDLRRYVTGRYGGKEETGDPCLFLKEMLVFNDRDESGWHDVLLTEAAPESLAARKYERTAPDEEAAFHFSEGISVAVREGKYGYTDRQGNEVIPYRYDWADAFDEGLAVVKRGDLFGVVDKRGNEVLAPVHEDIRWRSDNGVLLVCDEGKWTLAGRDGERITDRYFDFIFDFSEDLASVRSDGKYGYIDRFGKTMIPFIYDEAYSFSSEGLATVVKNGITFCIDTEGMVFD